MKSKILYVVAALLLSAQAQAFAPNEAIPASSVKRNKYVSDSTISGGDALANPVNLAAVKWGKNPAGYERVVIVLSGDGEGWETKTPPYFQVGQDSRNNTIDLSIHGVATRSLTESTLARVLARSSLISHAYLAPNLEGDLAALELQTRAPVDIESFYLVSPPRIVIDVRARR